jgi:hypothetical protein
MRYKFLILFVALLGLSAMSQNITNRYSFFVAGHSYGAPGVNNPGFHPPFKNKFKFIQNRAEIKFGVLTGDIVSANPIAKDWDEIDAEIESLGLPVYFAVGNHDMEDRPLFESRYDSTYYHFIYNNDLFIILDPNLDGWNITGTQLEFLESVLSSNSEKVSNIFVFFHQILWKESNNAFNYIKWNSSAGRDNTINFWSRIEPLFNSLNNEVIMFAGDLGASWASDVSYDKYDNITLISSGMGHEDGENFIVVNIDTNNLIDFDLICLSDTNLNCLGELIDYQMVDQVNNSSNSFFYPNPIGDELNASIRGFNNPTLQLFTLHGVLIFEKKVSNEPNQTINTSNIPKGFYLGRLFDKKNQILIKLYKE